MSANTSSAEQVLLNFRRMIAGDQIPDERFEEIVRRLYGQIDSAARSVAEEQATRIKHAESQSLALGATEMTFTWNDRLFANTLYAVCFYATTDPGAAVRYWIKSKTTSKVVIGVGALAVATQFTFIADE